MTLNERAFETQATKLFRDALASIGGKATAAWRNATGISRRRAYHGTGGLQAAINWAASVSTAHVRLVDNQPRFTFRVILSASQVFFQHRIRQFSLQDMDEGPRRRAMRWIKYGKSVWKEVRGKRRPVAKKMMYPTNFGIVGSVWRVKSSYLIPYLAAGGNARNQDGFYRTLRGTQIQDPTRGVVVLREFGQELGVRFDGAINGRDIYSGLLRVSVVEDSPLSNMIKNIIATLQQQIDNNKTTQGASK